jgi:alcohol dehydrogenase class IV
MAQIFYITQINFDFGALQTLAAECLRVGMTKPLIVTDAGVKAARCSSRPVPNARL